MIPFLLHPVLSLVLALATTATAPLEDQDVVRMVASGRASDEILEVIRTREVRFDLSEEMKTELRIAGVPEKVIEAMQKRQAEMKPGIPEGAQPERTERKRATLRVTLASAAAKPGERPVLWFPDRAGDSLARALALGPTAEERQISGLAVFLSCLTPDHVPDHWRSQSPLGRDFVSMPRHQMLVLHSGVARVAAKDVPRRIRDLFPRPRGDEPASGWLRLEAPAVLEADVEPGVAHDLLAGVAVLAGDRYLMVAEARKEGVVPTEDGVSLTVEASNRSDGFPVAIRFVDAEPPANAPQTPSRFPTATRPDGPPGVHPPRGRILPPWRACLRTRF